MIWDSTSSWSVSWTSFPDPPKGAGFVRGPLRPSPGRRMARHPLRHANSRRCAARTRLDSGACSRLGRTRSHPVSGRPEECAKDVENVWKTCGFLWKNGSTDTPWRPVVRLSSARHHPPGTSPTIGKPIKGPFFNDLWDFSPLSTRQIYDYNSSLTAPLSLLIRSIFAPLIVSNRGVFDPVDIRGSLLSSRAANC